MDDDVVVRELKAQLKAADVVSCSYKIMCWCPVSMPKEVSGIGRDGFGDLSMINVRGGWWMSPIRYVGRRRRRKNRIEVHSSTRTLFAESQDRRTSRRGVLLSIRRPAHGATAVGPTSIGGAVSGR